MQIWEEKVHKVSLSKPIYQEKGQPRGMPVHDAAGILFPARLAEASGRCTRAAISLCMEER